MVRRPTYLVRTWQRHVMARKRVHRVGHAGHLEVRHLLPKQAAQVLDHIRSRLELLDLSLGELGGPITRPDDAFLPPPRQARLQVHTIGRSARQGVRSWSLLRTNKEDHGSNPETIRGGRDPNSTPHDLL